MSNQLKQYYINPYQKEIEATIVKIVDNKLYFDKTIFYPEGGGQPADIGYVNDSKIIDTQKDKDQIMHIVDSVKPFNINDKVKLKLDWKHRYDYMKMHSAQHILSGLLFSYFNVNTLSVHQGETNLTIEIDRDDFCEESCYKLEDLANKVILDSKNISYIECSKDEAQKLNMRRSIKVDGLIRIVDIDSIDKIACGGLHVKNTKEIDRIMFIGFEKIRKHYRLIFRVSDKVDSTIREYDKIIKKLCTIHSATVDTLFDCDKALLDKKNELEREVRFLKKENTKYLIKSLLESNDEKVVCNDLSKYNIDFKDIEIDIDKAIFFYKIERDSIKWYIYLGKSFEKYTIKDIREKVLYLIDGKGGGRYPIFQGKGSIENIENCCASFIGYFNE